MSVDVLGLAIYMEFRDQDQAVRSRGVLTPDQRVQTLRGSFQPCSVLMQSQAPESGPRSCCYVLPGGKVKWEAFQGQRGGGAPG